MWNLERKRINITKVIDTENKQMVAKGEGLGGEERNR